MSLLHLEVLDSGHFSVLVNHALDNVVNLLLLSDILSLSLSLHELAFVNLSLDLVLIFNSVGDTGCFGLSIDLILDFFGPEHDLVDLRVLLLLAD